MLILGLLNLTKENIYWYKWLKNKSIMGLKELTEIYLYINPSSHFKSLNETHISKALKKQKKR